MLSSDKSNKKDVFINIPLPPLYLVLLHISFLNVVVFFIVSKVNINPKQKPFYQDEIAQLVITWSISTLLYNYFKEH